MAIIVAGHSHAAALGLKVPDESVSELIRLGDGPVELLGVRHGPLPPPVLMERIIELSAGSDLVLLWQGNYHNSRFLFSSGTPFDFVLSSEPELPVDPQVRLIPESLLMEALALEIRQIQGAVERFLAAQAQRKIALVCPPPPKDDEAYLRQHALREPAFDAFRELPLIAAPIRAKIWKLFARMHQDLCSKMGLRFIPAVPAAISEQGFLLPEYWEKDATHANALYGQRLLEHLQQQLKDQ